MQGTPNKTYLNPMESISIGYTLGNTEIGSAHSDSAVVASGHRSKMVLAATISSRVR